MSMSEAGVLDSPLAILGDEDIVSGFQALGFKPYSADEKEKYKKILDEIVSKKTAICLIEEEIFLFLKDKIDDYKKQALPVFIPFSKTERSPLLERVIEAISVRAQGAR
ncbi:MAG: V-type ATP synthase subunit F [Candidatus Omnitrophica bacterium]|nr:V-type ATP synthase subunit F [Candidatus Omnitrophota bacterium]